MSIELVKFDIAEQLSDRKAIADTAGVTRASLYKSLSESGTPALATIDNVMNQLGLKFSITPIKPSIKAGRTYAGGTVSGRKGFRVSEPAFMDAVGKRAAKSAAKGVAKKQTAAGKKPSPAPAKRA